MLKHQTSRIHIELGSLMRVVAMTLQMETIWFIQEDHASDGSSFPSISTFLQSKSSWCPSFNSRGLRMSISHIWPITPLFSQRGCLGTRLHGDHISAMATSGTAPFRRRATPHTGKSNFLYHDGSLITCVRCVCNHEEERWVDCLILQEPCDDSCNLRVLKGSSWKGVGSVPDNQEGRE